MPGAHGCFGVQNDAPEGANAFGGHGSGSSEPLGQKRSRGHSPVHALDERPLPLPYRPAGHRLQSACPASSWNEPAGQSKW